MRFAIQSIARFLALFANRSSIVGAACITAAIVVFALASLALSQSNDRPTPVGLVEGAFRLRSTSGEIVDNRALKGRPYAVFFGFTQCPAVCSTTLLEMISLARELGQRAADFKILFITLDPERDTAETLTTFLSSIGKEITGLTGSSDEIARAAKSFRVYYCEVRFDNGDYTIDHTAMVYLVDRTGRVVDLVSSDERHDIALKKIESLLLDEPSTTRLPTRFGAPEARAL